MAVSFSLITSPAWSLPGEVVPPSAIDLVEAGQRSEGASGVEEAKGRLRRECSAERRQKAEGRTQEAGIESQKLELTQNPLAIQDSAPLKTQNSSKGDASRTKLSSATALLKTQSSLACWRTALFKTQNSLTLHSPGSIDLDPKLIESSPVLQRWLKQVPDVLADIKRDPSFRTRLRLGYVQFPSSKQAGGLTVGIEDVFVGRSGLTLNADYQTAFNGSRQAWGGDLRYYVRPLGSVINLAPVVGYRHLETTRYSTDGIHVGLRLLLVPSRTAAADLAVTQSWVAPGSENEVGLTTLSFGYALTHNLRLSTDLQKQNSRFRSDSRVGISLEWMF